MFQAAGGAVPGTGEGSLLAVHATAAPPPPPRDLKQAILGCRNCCSWTCSRPSYYIAPRGYIALSLALTEDQLAGFVAAVSKVLDTRASLWAPPGERAQHPSSPGRGRGLVGERMGDGPFRAAPRS